MECQGFLFDLDGTLVDSLPVVERAWCRWADRFGIAHDEVLSFIHGKQAITSLRHFMAGSDEADIQREFYALEKLEAEDTDGIIALPGALALLEQLNAAGVPWAIVTSGSLPVASSRIRAAGLPEPKILVTAEQVANGKPHPDAWLLGAQRLALPPEACAVVEDSPAGIESGLAAGCRVIAVNAPQDTPRLAEADFAVARLDALRVSPRPGGLTLVESTE